MKRAIKRGGREEGMKAKENEERRETSNGGKF
jgi:hypothetical protein